jgi:hypothetical protein
VVLGEIPCEKNLDQKNLGPLIERIAGQRKKKIEWLRQKKRGSMGRGVLITASRRRLPTGRCA